MWGIPGQAKSRTGGSRELVAHGFSIFVAEWHGRRTCLAFLQENLNKYLLIPVNNYYYCIWFSSNLEPWKCTNKCWLYLIQDCQQKVTFVCQQYHGEILAFKHHVRCGFQGVPLHRKHSSCSNMSAWGQISWSTSIVSPFPQLKLQGCLGDEQDFASLLYGLSWWTQQKKTSSIIKWMLDCTNNCNNKIGMNVFPWAWLPNNLSYSKNIWY